MFCPKCGAEVKDEAEFCTKCGTKVEKDDTAESINIEDRETINSDERKLPGAKKGIFQNKKIAIMGGIIFLFGIGIGVFLLCFGSPIENVSRSIYKEAMSDVNYYQSDSFYKAVKATGIDTVKTPALLNQIEEKENKLLERCSNDDERTFVKKAYSVAKIWSAAAVSKSITEIVKQKQPNRDFTDLENEVSKLYVLGEKAYKTLINAKSIEELNDI